MTRARDTLPGWLREPLAARRRSAYLRLGLKALHAQGASRTALRWLHVGWGNQGASADPGFLTAVLDELSRTDGPVLECGSGLTTLAMSVRARPGQVWTLEHDQHWHRRTAQALATHGGPGVRLLHAPLTAHGDLQWYSMPSELPTQFSLVVCDGPPHWVVGGRSGLWLAAGDRVAGARVLLDDVRREAERSLVERLVEQGWSTRVSEGRRAFATLWPQAL